MNLKLNPIVEKLLRAPLVASVSDVMMRALASKEPNRLYFVGDFSNWVLSWEVREIATIAEKLGIDVGYGLERLWGKNQAVFFANQGDILARNWKLGGHRVGFAYFHGKPGTSDVFTESYEQLKRHHERISRLQVSHSQMRDIVLESGIREDKVHLIPIGLNDAFFSPQTPESRRQYREKYKIPQEAVVIGSFQKDGNGWGEGLEPKLIKGPDILVESLGRLNDCVDNLHVLLSGPSRGYVKKRLTQLGIAHHHFYLDDYPQVGELFQCLDGYIISSRQEGGPKAVLESMASAVPLVSTRVGQAMDLVEDGVNGFLVDVEDVDGIVDKMLNVLTNSEMRQCIISEGLSTAAKNTYRAQYPLWKGFMKDFV